MSNSSSPASPLFEQALSLHQSGRLQEACAAYRKVLARSPRHAQASLLLATAVSQMGELEKAVALYGKALALQADNAAAFEGRGNALTDLGRFSEALADYNKAIELSPYNPDAHCARAVAQHALGRYAEALVGFDEAVAIDQNFAEAWSNRGNTLLALKRPQEALNSFDRAIACHVDYAEAHSNRGVALTALNRTDEALQSIDKAIALQPERAEAWLNRGNALIAANRPSDALLEFQRALARRPDYAPAHFGCGLSLQRQRKMREAQICYQSALRSRPDYPEALNHLAVLRHVDGNHQEAVQLLRRALSLEPDYAEAHANLGSVCLVLGQVDEARRHLARAIELAPDLSSARIDRASLLADSGDHEAAVADLEAVVARDPYHPYALGLALGTQMRLADWSNFESYRSLIESGVQTSARVAPPLVISQVCADPALQKQGAAIWVDDLYPPNQSLGDLKLPPRSTQERIRVGYFSSDFRAHPVSVLCAELFELHDRRQFEVIGFDFGPRSEDAFRLRVSRAFDQFIDIRGLSDEAAARLAREMGLHIAVDLNGHTLFARTGIFARRAAPVQISYLGYPATSGASYIDYVIADAVVMPASLRPHFSEHVLYLPACFQVNDRQRRASDQRFSRSELGLPDDGFVYCCFNNSSKLTPEQFFVWMQILQRVPQAVLWLIADNSAAALRLQQMAERQGVSSSRLVFARRRAAADYLAQYRQADLFLDCLPYNAGTTASDALWMGVPVLTQAGNTYAGRMAASLLTAAGLAELITDSDQAYVDLAVGLAADRSRLTDIRQHLISSRDALPLFDTPQTVHHLEAGYRLMVQRYERGLPSADITIRSN